VSIERAPRWKGRPVPYITAWTEEDRGGSFHLVGPGRGIVAYVGELVVDRDHHGVLWQRQSGGRGGEPQWREVHSRRQRLAMVVPRCQVCGTSLKGTSPIPWLIPLVHLLAHEANGLGEGDPFEVETPPTCLACVPHARLLCPFLHHHGARLLLVEDYRLVGVFGDLAWREEDGQITHSQGTIYYGTQGMGNVLARQQVAELTQWRVAPETRR
jgi:hypothetical protein